MRSSLPSHAAKPSGPAPRTAQDHLATWDQTHQLGACGLFGVRVLRLGFFGLPVKRVRASRVYRVQGFGLWVLQGLLIRVVMMCWALKYHTLILFLKGAIMK